MSTSTEEKKRYVLEYIRSLVAIEEAMEPYKEQKRELRTEFREQGWLNTAAFMDKLDENLQKAMG